MTIALGAFTSSRASCTDTISAVIDSNGAYVFTALGASPGDSIFWNFGDNTIGSGSPLVHAYNNGGYYAVTLIVSGGGCTSTSRDTVYVRTGTTYSCQATISVSNANTTGGNYAFTLTGTFSNQAIAIWNWNDGTPAMQTNPSVCSYHRFTTSGYQIVCLQVIDSSVPCQFTACDTFFIPATSPCATAISYTNLDTTFSLFASCTGIAPFTYVWRLPAANSFVYNSSNLPNPVITLPTPVPYTAYPVWVYVTDSTGCVDSAWTYIYPDSILNPANACRAYFVMIQDTANVGSYYAVDLSIGSGGSLTYTWSFGDGTSASGQYPTHNYATPGYYAVCLNIMDSLNRCNSSFCDSNFYAHKRLGGPMASFAVRPRNTSGVEDIKQTADLFTVYPNPATSVIELRISNSDKIIRGAVYSISGQKVTETGAATKVSVSNLALGMYFVEVKTNTGTYRSSFVKHD